MNKPIHYSIILMLMENSRLPRNFTIVDRIQSNDFTVQKGLYFRYSLFWKFLFLTNQAEVLGYPFLVSLILFIDFLVIKLQDFL